MLARLYVFIPRFALIQKPQADGRPFIATSATLSELCIRWALRPAESEVAAATSTLGSRLAAASGPPVTSGAKAVVSTTAPPASAAAATGSAATPTSKPNGVSKHDVPLQILGLAAIVGLIL
jgi:hypothetical protein